MLRAPADRSRNEDVRKRAALDLKDLVVITARGKTREHCKFTPDTRLTSSLDYPPERFAEFYSTVNSKITQLISHGNDPIDRLGGVMALDALIDFDGVDAAQKTTRFMVTLRTVLRGKDLVAMQPAAVALGKLCR